jgi:hypothetical protein
MKAGFREATPAEVKKAISENRAGATLSQYSDAELAKINLYKLDVPGAEIYYGLKYNPPLDAGSKPALDVVLVMNNSPELPGIAARKVLTDAIARWRLLGGADRFDLTLDAFDVNGFLPKRYARHGFKEYDRVPYDAEAYPPTPEMITGWKQDGWKEGDPYPDVVYMRYEDDGSGAGSGNADRGATGQDEALRGSNRPLRAADAVGAIRFENPSDIQLPRNDGLDPRQRGPNNVPEPGTSREATPGSPGSATDAIADLDPTSPNWRQELKNRANEARERWAKGAYKENIGFGLGGFDPQRLSDLLQIVLDALVDVGGNIYQAGKKLLGMRGLEKDSIDLLIPEAVRANYIKPLLDKGLGVSEIINKVRQVYPKLPKSMVKNLVGQELSGWARRFEPTHKIGNEPVQLVNGTYRDRWGNVVSGSASELKPITIYWNQNVVNDFLKENGLEPLRYPLLGTNPTFSSQEAAKKGMSQAKLYQHIVDPVNDTYRDRWGNVVSGSASESEPIATFYWDRKGNMLVQYPLLDTNPTRTFSSQEAAKKAMFQAKLYEHILDLNNLLISHDTTIRNTFTKGSSVEAINQGIAASEEAMRSLLRKMYKGMSEDDVSRFIMDQIVAMTSKPQRQITLIEYLREKAGGTLSNETATKLKGLLDMKAKITKDLESIKPGTRQEQEMSTSLNLLNEQLVRIGVDVQRTSTAEALLSLWKGLLLLTVKNPITNMKGNSMQSLFLAMSRPVRAGADTLLSKVTGQRTRISTVPGTAKRTANWLKNNVKSVADVSKGMVTGDFGKPPTGKYDQYGKANSGLLRFRLGGKPVSPVDGLVNRAFGAVATYDKPYFELAYNHSLMEQATAKPENAAHLAHDAHHAHPRRRLHRGKRGRDRELLAVLLQPERGGMLRHLPLLRIPHVLLAMLHVDLPIPLRDQVVEHSALDLRRLIAE